MNRLCTIWWRKFLTIQWTRPWPAMRRELILRSMPTYRLRLPITDAASRLTTTRNIPANPLWKLFLPLCTPAASSAATPIKFPADCTASALRSLTPCPNGWWLKSHAIKNSTGRNIRKANRLRRLSSSAMPRIGAVRALHFCPMRRFSARITSLCRRKSTVWRALRLFCLRGLKFSGNARPNS